MYEVPLCTLSANPQQIQTGTSVAFTLNGQDGWENLVQIAYGDGATGGSIANHTYNNTGLYLAIVTLKNNLSGSITNTCTTWIQSYASGISNGCVDFSGFDTQVTYDEYLAGQVAFTVPLDAMKSSLAAAGMTGITASGTISTVSSSLLLSFTSTITNQTIGGLTTGNFPLQLNITLMYTYSGQNTVHALQASYSFPQYYSYSGAGNDTYDIPFLCTDLSYCGDAAVSSGEACDSGTGNGVACDPAYNDSCSYCSSICTTVSNQ